MPFNFDTESDAIKRRRALATGVIGALQDDPRGQTFSNAAGTFYGGGPTLFSALAKGLGAYLQNKTGDRFGQQQRDLDAQSLQTGTDALANVDRVNRGTENYTYRHGEQVGPQLNSSGPEVANSDTASSYPVRAGDVPAIPKMAVSNLGQPVGQAGAAPAAVARAVAGPTPEITPTAATDANMESVRRREAAMAAVTGTPSAASPQVAPAAPAGMPVGALMPPDSTEPVFSVGRTDATANDQIAAWTQYGQTGPMAAKIAQEKIGQLIGPKVNPLIGKVFNENDSGYINERGELVKLRDGPSTKDRQFQLDSAKQDFEKNKLVSEIVPKRAEAQTRLNDASTANEALSRAAGVVQKYSPTGGLGSTVYGSVAGAFGSDAALEYKTALDTVAALNLKALFGGAPSDAEGQRVSDIVGNFRQGKTVTLANLNFLLGAVGRRMTAAQSEVEGHNTVLHRIGFDDTPQPSADAPAGAGKTKYDWRQ